jgi:hypothetical protein
MGVVYLARNQIITASGGAARTTAEAPGPLDRPDCFQK